MTTTDIGRLSEQVTITNLTRTDDGGGGYVETWASDATVWAQVESFRGQERLQAEALDVTLTHVVRLRYIQSVGPHSRILWGDRVLEIIGPPAELGRRALLECYCAERLE